MTTKRDACSGDGKQAASDEAPVKHQSHAVSGFCCRYRGSRSAILCWDLIGSHGRRSGHMTCCYIIVTEKDKHRSSQGFKPATYTVFVPVTKFSELIFNMKPFWPNYKN